MNKNNTIVQKTNDILRDYILKKDNAEVRTLNTTTGALMIPTHLSKEIVEAVERFADVFSKATKVNSKGKETLYLLEKGLTNCTFVGEDEELAGVEVPAFNEVKMPHYRLATGIELTQQMLNDSEINLSEYIKELLVRRIVNKLTNDVVRSTTGYTLPTMAVPPLYQTNGYLATTARSIDHYIHVYNRMPQEYLKGAEFYMNFFNINELKTFKDASGKPYITERISEDHIGFYLFGCPVNIVDAMHNNRVLFANVKEACVRTTIKDLTIKVISDDTTNALKGSVTIIADMYVGFATINRDASFVLRYGAPAAEATMEPDFVPPALIGDDDNENAGVTKSKMTWSSYDEE